MRSERARIVEAEAAGVVAIDVKTDVNLWTLEQMAATSTLVEEPEVERVLVERLGPEISRRLLALRDQERGSNARSSADQPVPRTRS